MGAKDTVFHTNKTLCLKGKILDLSTPVVMGILNITPDSFYDGGSHQNIDKAVERAGQMLEQGVTIIDIGGYSSRPGAADITEAQELDRILPAIEAVIHTFPEAYISVDTFRSGIARNAVKAGACMINDISGGTLDGMMFETISQLQVPYILMHMRGSPQTMKSLTSYDDLVVELIKYFEDKVYQLRKLELKDIIIDVGFGFAKTIEQNYQLLKNLEALQIFNLPILAGLSRKSMIYRKLTIPVTDALNGTTVLNTLALTKGASVLRVHDVKEAVEVIKLFKLYNEY